MMTLHAVSPLHGLMIPGKHGYNKGQPQVSFQETYAQLVQLTPKRGQEKALEQAMRTHMGIGLAQTGQWQGDETEDGRRIIWSGLNQWMLQSSANNQRDLYQICLEHCAPYAAVVEQSHGRCIIQLSGKAAPEVLKRHSHIDLHLDSFTFGQVAITQIAHISVLLLRLDDTVDTHEPCFELHVFRGFAESLWEELSHSAAQFGYEVRQI